VSCNPHPPFFQYQAPLRLGDAAAPEPGNDLSSPHQSEDEVQKRRVQRQHWVIDQRGLPLFCPQKEILLTTDTGPPHESRNSPIARSEPEREVTDANASSTSLPAPAFLIC